MTAAPSTPEPSDAILTVPNLLTFARLALVPAFVWLALGPRRMDLAFTLAAVGMATDLVDGKIARRFGQVSKLGVRLDPLSDRLALAAGAVVLIAHHLAPVWVVAAVVVRDAALLFVGVTLIKTAGAEIPPVSRLGKRGSFAVSAGFALFLASGISSIADPSIALRSAAWVFMAPGLLMYYLAAVGYVRAGRRAIAESTGR
ncbi:MAG: CDP-alcohol phosphatidyltransferase family protein [Actinomycetota bacterium]